MLDTTKPIIGSAVTYHGSKTEDHGPALVIDFCDCDECFDMDLTRYVLYPGEFWPTTRRARVLSHVRRESFTPKETTQP